MGLDLDEELCGRNMVEIVERARAHGGFVRLDMESSAYTQRTLDFFYRRLLPGHGAHCGVVVQSALRRTPDRTSRPHRRRRRIRLCKGAYVEPASVAFAEKGDVDAAYVTLMERLLRRRATFPGIATHDEQHHRAAPAVRRSGRTSPATASSSRCSTASGAISRSGSVRRGLQVRVYVPFGTQWYPYLMRRLAERPANIAFMMGNVLKESVSRR